MAARRFFDPQSKPLQSLLFCIIQRDFLFYFNRRRPLIGFEQVVNILLFCLHKMSLIFMLTWFPSALANAKFYKLEHFLSVFRKLIVSNNYFSLNVFLRPRLNNELEAKHGHALHYFESFFIATRHRVFVQIKQNRL